MALITEKSGVCLSPMGETTYPACDMIKREGEEKLVFTEGGLGIGLDDPCFRVDFNCDEFERETVASGKSVSITNTCSLPIVITGLLNSDPVRFSLFEYGDYVGLPVYDSGTAPDYIPIELLPYDRVDIPVFFHPRIEELYYGKAGTYDNRVGNYFTGRIDIMPGFPIFNCREEGDPCTAYFYLSGEFICPTADLPEFMANDNNFTTPFVGNLPGIGNNVYCIPNTNVHTLGFMPSSFPATSSWDQKVFSALEDLLDPYGVSFKSRDARPQYWAANMVVYEMVTGLIAQGQDGSLSNLLNSNSLDVTVDKIFESRGGHKYFAEMTGSYVSQNYEVIDTHFYDALYTGLHVQVLGGGGGAAMTNATVAFQFVEAGGAYKGRVFISESGDFSTFELC